MESSQAKTQPLWIVNLGRMGLSKMLAAMQVWILILVKMIMMTALLAALYIALVDQNNGLVDHSIVQVDQNDALVE